MKLRLRSPELHEKNSWLRAPEPELHEKNSWLRAPEPELHEINSWLRAPELELLDRDGWLRAPGRSQSILFSSSRLRSQSLFKKLQGSGLRRGAS
ncbi:unnamed protein product [Bemisia tabaci]|uniref:Uncharacterized protein n=1 Tax=Bemisia tabaci TaxID=7038 RepID=A0A9P0A8N1_BEMTA|nr:unnamed protein product [Bemisia tabaci]